ncbi:Regulator of G-protein signaling 7, partial [Trichinella patagoniensis]
LMLSWLSYCIKNKHQSLNAWQSWTYKRCFSLVLHLEQLHQLITEIQLLAIMSSFPMFRKMDELCIQMMKPDSGLPIKGQKYFRTSVPSSFTGSCSSELIEWLMTNLEEVDQAEALHLANQLSAFGYLFSVFDASAPVKEDNCLYRLQIPYFWPSSNMQPDSIEYAIFLSKRLLRNEEKHGLVEYEAESYQKLRELLGHMWDFVQSQAEMQLKLFKEKKKSEKVVFDSQEKAYWRIHRPPPGTVCCIEESYGKLEKRIKKKCIKDYQRDCVQIERLKQILKTKPWLKSPKSLETLVSWCDQFSNYDPMLTPPRDPGNPWIVDDPTLWQLNANNFIINNCFSVFSSSVEVPTERRVRRWGFSIHELIKDPIGRQVLETFLESEFSQENIRFWLAVQDLKYSPSSEVNAKVAAIYNEFLVAGAPCQVNVDSQTLETVTKALKDQTVPLRYCFSQAEEHIFILMSKDSYPRFARSEIYRSMLAAAQQQGSKKLGWRWHDLQKALIIIPFNQSFLFGGNHGPLKKSQTSRTSPQGFYKNRDEGSTARLQNVVDMTKKSTLEPGDAISGTQPKNSPTFTCDGADSLDVEVPLK